MQTSVFCYAHTPQMFKFCLSVYLFMFATHATHNTNISIVLVLSCTCSIATLHLSSLCIAHPSACFTCYIHVTCQFALPMCYLSVPTMPASLHAPHLHAQHPLSAWSLTCALLPVNLLSSFVTLGLSYKCFACMW